MTQPAPNAPSGKQHLPQLDVLRGLAILSVFVFHCLGKLYGTNQYNWNGVWRDFHVVEGPANNAAYFLSLGWVGVPLFFVLSGFVIHYSFLTAKRFDLSSFYKRRFWRIYPAYFLALCVFSVVQHVSFTKAGLFDFGTHALLIHNLFPRTFFSIDGSFWSLAPEVQFYVAYPLLLRLRSRFGMLNALRATLGLSIVCRLVLLCFSSCSNAVDPQWASPLILWFDWSLGAYIAEKYCAGERAFNIHKAWIVVGAVVFVLASLFKPTNAFTFSIASVVFALIVDRYLYRPRLNLLERMLVPVGLCSYSLYLWHQPVLNPMFDLLHGIGVPSKLWANVLVVIPVTFIVFLGGAWLLYLWVEKPLARIAHRSRKPKPTA